MTARTGSSSRPEKIKSMATAWFRLLGLDKPNNDSLKGTSRGLDQKRKAR